MTNHRVSLYVYDLSNGLARALSLPLTGKQIDGIWHTSVVVWNREIFYGAGVMETLPGRSHHGQPIQTIDCGTTEIPQEVFDDYLDDLKERYTAGAYHLLDFNCNSFTQDVVGFLTGSTIPSWISSLPADFLSTPFGQQLKPQIDQMYSGRVGASMPMGPGLGAGLLAGIAGQASGPPPTTTTASKMGGSHSGGTKAGSNSISTSTTSSLFIVTNPASFASALSAHPSSIVMLRSRSTTTQTTESGRNAVELKFEEMAKEEDEGNKKDVEFLVVDVDAGKGEEVASGICGIKVEELRDGPVFVLFRDGEKSEVIKDTDPDSLEAAIVWHIAQVQDASSSS